MSLQDNGGTFKDCYKLKGFDAKRMPAQLHIDLKDKKTSVESGGCIEGHVLLNSEQAVNASSLTLQFLGYETAEDA